MKKVMVLLMSLFVVIGLTACGGETENKEISKVEKESDETEQNESENNESQNNETEASEEVSYDQVLIDSEIATVTLEGISSVSDDIFGDSHVIKVAIENKSDKVIVVQTDKVSIDGLMVTDNVFFSEEVAASKRANGKIEIQMFDDDELPPLDEELEMVLKVIDEETYGTIEEEQVNIEIK